MNSHFKNVKKNLNQDSKQNLGALELKKQDIRLWLVDEEGTRTWTSINLVGNPNKTKQTKIQNFIIFSWSQIWNIIGHKKG